MKINIHDYNNIENLEYEIYDKKINYLFGISGAGKSSIASALTNDNLDDHIPFGHNNSHPEVLVNNELVDYQKFSMFDINYMTNVLIEKKQGTDIYNIIIGDSGNIDYLKSQYNTSIDDLLKLKLEIYSLQGKISTLMKDLKIDYKKDGNYKAQCLIGKLTSNVDDKKTNYIQYKKYSSKRINWFSEGKNTEEYANDKCPFCNRKLTENKKKTIDKIIIFDAKSYEKINSKNGIFEDLKLNMPDWIKKKEVTKFNKSLFEICSLLPELEQIIKYMQLANKTDLSLDGLEPIKVSCNMKKYYPEISKALDDFKANYQQIRKKFIAIKRATDKLVSSNLRLINNYLDLLGIEYSFNKESIDDENKNATFVVTHNSLKEKKDCVKNLSYGEKNIIGLVLFMISHKDKELLIIDDPASSYDEYRRKVIFNLLYNLKGEDSTFLVLSHDHVFAKYAIYHLNAPFKNSNNPSKIELEYKNLTGTIDYIETFDKAVIKRIEPDDFKSISEFIIERLNCLGDELTYQVAINLRMYYEINKCAKYHKIIYGYLSSILHKVDKIKIIKRLTDENKEEKEILELISNDLGIQYSILKDDYNKHICIDYFCSFEKIIYARECCPNTNQGKVIKEELSNIVHMNLAYAVCLNPYKYNYFSQYVYKYITNTLDFNL